VILTPTVLVLGAGASSHLGFPLGGGLKTFVWQTLLNGTNSAYERLLVNCGHSAEELRAFALTLRRSHQPSIDLFVEPDVHKSLRPLAKNAIAAALIPYEGNDHLHAEPGWYEYLFQRIGSRIEHFERSLISIITFNYDRSIESFFFDTLKTAFGLDDRGCAAFMRSHLPIVHVSGRLGALPAFANDTAYTRDYSTFWDPESVIRCGTTIKILSDGVDSEELATARGLLAAAKVVCFLGFGYHETNLARLRGPDGVGLGPTSVYGSAQNIFDGERPTIQRQMPGIQLGHNSWKVQEVLQQMTILRDSTTAEEGGPLFA
jgi:hypothetical protein